jgi:hypothetical protein
LTALVAFVATQVAAENPATINVTVTITAGALSVSVTPTDWAAGALAEGGSSDTGTTGFFTAKNESTNVTENFSILAFSSANWTPGATAGSETFVMEAVGGDLATLTSIHTSQTLETGLAPTDTVTFDLKLTVPTSTAHGGVEQNIRVEITASAS